MAADAAQGRRVRLQSGQPLFREADPAHERPIGIKKFSVFNGHPSGVKANNSIEGAELVSRALIDGREIWRDRRVGIMLLWVA